LSISQFGRQPQRLGSTTYLGLEGANYPFFAQAEQAVSGAVKAPRRSC